MYELIEKLFCWCYPLLLKSGMNSTLALYGSLLVNIVLLCFLAYLIYLVFRIILVTVLAIVASKTKTKFDDLLVDNKTAKYIAYLIPFLFIYKSVPIILKDFVKW
jgi:miniconductance mechanosensitive channel